MKRLAILGSTGSIGRQTLDVVRRLPDELKVVGLTAHSNSEELLRQAEEFGVKRLALMDGEAAQAAGVPGGMSAIEAAACDPDVDVVVVAVAGVIGLLPTLAALRAGKQIALASKEVLVAAGEIVMPLVREMGATMTPIDSEHSALFQCLLGSRSDQIESLIITGSGGPFRGRTRADLESVTVEQALKHPTWSMGGKITIDSATLMNKGLEVIEARWLFGVELNQVEVVIHPQSVVHSMVRFRDGSVLGQLGWPDMRLPIQYALLHPDRTPGGLPRWDPTATPTLTFEEPDRETFRLLNLAYQAGEAGGTMPCVLNAANEAAVGAFLKGGCGFLQIADVVEKALELHARQPASLESLLEADAWARETVRNLIGVA